MLASPEATEEERHAAAHALQLLVCREGKENLECPGAILDTPEPAAAASAARLLAGAGCIGASPALRVLEVLAGDPASQAAAVGALEAEVGRGSRVLETLAWAQGGLPLEAHGKSANQEERCEGGASRGRSGSSDTSRSSAGDSDEPDGSEDAPDPPTRRAAACVAALLAEHSDSAQLCAAPGLLRGLCGLLRPGPNVEELRACGAAAAALEHLVRRGCGAAVGPFLRGERPQLAEAEPRPGDSSARLPLSAPQPALLQGQQQQPPQHQQQQQQQQQLAPVATARACAACGKTEQAGVTRLRQCAGCHATRYCSTECARQHWKAGGHRAECTRLQREQARQAACGAAPCDACPGTQGPAATANGVQ
ncbi:hypothetical protein MNEG_6248 [Monoraphidium neglectum]|uniref:MYND-type domain-containing protein n=1 Tax=Monoraphidium neglectum TaxID=145388 RepID=A0A0D2MME1_9CHLO|nr:hypothetical protein MNEG_6248 [Monoraphidium neglectum]KIZ01712.1 hypothetical protein MNEG_6248 [Monoraphidium neglectum]|eukprot:XP_013900731.1 hypothetical protein MNEG_6248 [Monoraphidium neglectum]